MNREAGTALPVVAAILVGVGLIVTGYTYLRTETRETRQETSATPNLERVADQIAAFARVNKRLPAPADAQSSTGIEDSTTPASRAMVPWRTLGLDGAADPWGRMISYRAYTPATAPNSLANGGVTATQGMEVCTPSGCETGVGFVVFSHGLAGRGGFNSDGTLAAATTAGSREAGNVAVTGANGQQMFAWTRTSPTDTDEPFDHILEWRPLSSLIVSPGSGGQPCIPSSVFAGGLAATGNGGIELSGSVQLNNMPNNQLTTTTLGKPKNGYDHLTASGIAGQTIDIVDAPPAPANSSTIDYIAGNWPNTDPVFSSSQEFRRLAVTSGGSLTLNSPGTMTVNVAQAVDLGYQRMTANGDITLHAGSLTAGGGHRATFNGTGSTVLNVHGQATIHGGSSLSFVGNSYLYTEDLTINGSQGITVSGGTLVVIVHGDLDIGGNDAISAGPGAGVLILVDGNVTFRGSSSAEAYIYATGTADMTGAASLTGSLVAGTVTMGGSATINYISTAPGGVGNCG